MGAPNTATAWRAKVAKKRVAEEIIFEGQIEQKVDSSEFAGDVDQRRGLCGATWHQRGCVWMGEQIGRAHV